MNSTMKQGRMARTAGRIGSPSAGGVDHSDGPRQRAPGSGIPSFDVPRAASCRTIERNYEWFCVDWFVPESDRAGQSSGESG